MNEHGMQVSLQMWLLLQAGMASMAHCALLISRGCPTMLFRFVRHYAGVHPILCRAAGGPVVRAAAVQAAPQAAGARHAAATGARWLCVRSHALQQVGKHASHFTGYSSDDVAQLSCCAQTSTAASNASQTL